MVIGWELNSPNRVEFNVSVKSCVCWFVRGGTVLGTYATPICFLTEKAPHSAPFCRVVLVVQPRDGSRWKKTNSDEYVFDPACLLVAEMVVLRGQQFENRGSRYCYLTPYNIHALASHDAVVPTPASFDMPWLSCVGCEPGNAGSAVAGPTAASTSPSSAWASSCSASGGPSGYDSPKYLQIISFGALGGLHVIWPKSLAYSVHMLGQVVYLHAYSLSMLFRKQPNIAT